MDIKGNGGEADHIRMSVYRGDNGGIADHSFEVGV